MRRLSILALTSACALTAAACASTGQSQSYADDYAQLNADCQARGGILTPIAGSTGSRAATDYACEIRGGGSGRIN